MGNLCQLIRGIVRGRNDMDWTLIPSRLIDSERIYGPATDQIDDDEDRFCRQVAGEVY